MLFLLYHATSCAGHYTEEAEKVDSHFRLTSTCGPELPFYYFLTCFGVGVPLCLSECLQCPNQVRDVLEADVIYLLELKKKWRKIFSAVTNLKRNEEFEITKKFSSDGL